MPLAGTSIGRAYGVTSIVRSGQQMLSTGADGTVKAWVVAIDRPASGRSQDLEQ
jgi:hypothetical protein